MLISILESINKSQRLVNVSSDGQVPNRHVTEDACCVNNVSCSKRNACIRTVLDETAVVPSDLMGHVSEQGHVHWAKSAKFTFLLGVLHVHKVGINRASDELCVALLELVGLVAELADLSWADEGEVEGPEEETNVFA